MNRTCTLDIETNDLLANMLDYSSLPYKLNNEAVLHCIVVTDVKTLESVILVGDEITAESVESALAPYNIIVAHNGLKFDFISLFLFNVFDYQIGELGEQDLLFGREVRFLDSLVISRILNPDRLGGHGAEAWGKRLGELKTDFRGESIKQGLIPSDAPPSAEFKVYSPLMGEYCVQDTIVNAKMYVQLLEELGDFNVWRLALQQEHKLADRAIRRETFGFDFDKDYALRNLDFLIPKMQELSDNVTPRLPKKPFNQGELSDFTPPKNQVKADGDLTVHFKNFLKRHNMDYDKEMACVTYKGDWLSLPLIEPLETEREATIDDLDVVKAYLIDLGWKPTDWKERDLTKDSKKQNISPDKRLKALEKYVQETLGGKYKTERLELLGCTEQNLEITLKRNIYGQRAVKVFTTPNVRVGVTKELCPNLIKLGDKVDFVKDFVEYLTYKHRKSSIAGGDIEDIDFDNEVPQSGYLYQVREQDGRIATPAIEIGASCVVKGSLLTTNKGLRCITEVAIGDTVLTHTGVYKKIIDKIDNGVKNIFKVTLENGLSLTCTSNHPFWTTQGWVVCEQLEYNTEVYCYGDSIKWINHPVFKNYQGSNTGLIRNKRGKLLKPMTSKISGKPYTVDLYNGKGKKSRRSVGKFIIECFKGIVPTGLEVLHNDGNNTNNNLSNLRFGTSKENSEDSLKHGFIRKIRANKVLKLTDDQVKEIRDFQKDNDFKYGQDTELANKFKVTREYIRDIRKGKRRALEPTESTYTEKFVTSRVSKIERLGVDNTYDITVEGDHSYVVNSIVTHNTNRYKHIGVANVPRASSLFGEQMRSMFGAGKDYIQFGFDYASLEARIEGHYIYPYEGGADMAVSLLAEKPNDIHSLTAVKLNIPRDDAKSVNYAILYGASANKFVKMLGYTQTKAKQFVIDWWDMNLALKQLKEDKEAEWIASGKKYITSIDGRRINIRSQHSILNALFQSAGVICAKYVLVKMFEKFDKLGYKTDCFRDTPDIAEMISYHDEAQLAVNPKLIKFKVFDTRDGAKEFSSKWDTEELGQLGAIQEGKEGKFFITLPSDISKIISESIKEVEEMFNMQVNLGYEYVCGRNWFQCH